MLRAIETVENSHAKSISPELHYWLGIAWRNYTAWFVRGAGRKPFLQKAATHLERAYLLEEDKSGSTWRGYACELGALLADEALIRDLDRAIPVFEAVFSSTDRYEPLLCSFAEAVYKTGDYEKAASVATELHNRAKRAQKEFGCVPPAPMRIAAKALRARTKHLKKEGDARGALSVSEELLRTGCATETDRRNHEKLETQIRGK
jgi:hypothetical protein